jgi:nucleoid-associated protein YgaU
MTALDATIGGAASLEKLTIWYEVKPGPFKQGSYRSIPALFNPSQLRYDNRAEWRATGTVAQSVAGGFQRMEFQATPPATLSVDLFFDTYEGAPKAGAGSMLGTLRTALVPDNPFSAGTPSFVDVQQYTEQVANLVHVQSELHRPPVCRLQWGKTVLFEGVLTQLHQDFTFFMPDGTPVRATLGCTFMAYRTFDQAVTDVELHSADVAKQRIVRRGDTLDSIAVEEYSDGTQWRAIALENAIDNPRVLMPGQVLVIPKLTT